MNSEEYCFVEKMDINEGYKIKMRFTRAAVIFTKRFAFVIPFKTHDPLNQRQTNFTEAKDFIKKMLIKAEELSTEQFHAEMFGVLDPDFIFEISNLEKFKVHGGIFGGGGLIKRRGEAQKIIAFSFKNRKKVKAFYDI